MAYSKQSWENGNPSTPISSSRLNHIEDGIEDAHEAVDGLPTAAKTGSYDDLTDKPALKTVATTGSYTDLTDKPSLSTVATSGQYADLQGKPSLSTVANTGAYSDLTGLPVLSTVATSGSYSDLTNKPSTSANGTFIMFSTMAGTNDDDRLANAITAAQSTTNKGRTIVLDENRDYTFTTQVVIPNGFSLQGPFRPQDQPRSSRPVGNRILLRMAGSSSGKGWLKIGSGNVFGISVRGLSIDADINSGFFDGTEDNGGVLWTSVFENISMQNGKFSYGSKENRLAITDVVWSGFHNYNNVRQTTFNLAGSDSRMVPDLMLVDSPSELLDFNEYLMHSNYLANFRSTNIYVTAEAHSALYIGGSNNGSQSVIYRDWECEGRNENHPSPGALVRIDAGQGQFKDTRFAFGMANPSLITNRVDKGVIHINGGDWAFDGCTYERGNTVTAWVPPASPTTGDPVGEDVPFIYVGAGAKRVRVRNIIGNGPFTGSRSWTGKPVVKQAVDGLVDADDSVTVVTAQTADAPNAAGDTTTGSANSGTSITIDKPANVVEGDLILAATYARGGSAVYTTPPSGWNVVNPSADNTAAGVIRLYWKTATGSEPSSYTWAGGGSGRHAGVITRVTGSTASPVDASGAAATLIGGPDRIILPSVTTTNELDLLVMVGGSSSTGGVVTTFTGPAGTSVVASGTTNTGASESAISLVIQKAQPAGATGTRVLTASDVASTGVGYMAAIKSAG